MTETHVERPMRLAGGKTYCACGAPWPCEHAPATTGTAGLREDMRVLMLALVKWSARDDTTADPATRHAASVAMNRIDRLLAELYLVRSRLLHEMRASDDAASARVDALLKTRSDGRGGG